MTGWVVVADPRFEALKLLSSAAPIERQIPVAVREELGP